MIEGLRFGALFLLGLIFLIKIDKFINKIKKINNKIKKINNND